MKSGKTTGMFAFLTQTVIVSFVAIVTLFAVFSLTACTQAKSSTSVASQSSPAASITPQATTNVQDHVKKSEMVYGMLNADGTLKDTYVVNRFISDTPGLASDYGPYTAVSNLSTSKKLVCEDNVVSLEIGDTPFFYQGTLENVQLPWNVSFAYSLNGKSIDAAQLAGAVGTLGVTVKTSANTQVNHAFYDSFMLQITFTLDGGLCSDIKAENATIAASGKDHTVAFTVLPGHDGSFKLSAQVKDFEMPSIQIAALPYSSVIEMPDTSDMEGGLNNLSYAISQLNAGTSELANGVAQLSSGAEDLASGAKSFGEGLSQLSSTSPQIVNASSQVNDALAQLAGTLQGTDLSGIEKLGAYGPALNEMAKTLETLKVAMQGMVNGFTQMSETMDLLASVVQSNPLSDQEIATLRASVSDDQQAAGSLEKLLGTYQAVQSIIAGYAANSGSLATQLPQLEELVKDGGALDQIINTLKASAEFFSSDDISKLGQLNQLATGLSDLSNGYGQFHTGLVTYTQGVQALNNNYGALSNGMSDLASGTSQLTDGAYQLSSGVAQLDAATNNLSAQMRQRMGELMAEYEFPEFNPVSFVDERNKNVTAVQFVMLTDAIEKPKPEPAEPEPEPEPTIVDRFLALFGA